MEIIPGWIFFHPRNARQRRWDLYSQWDENVAHSLAKQVGVASVFVQVHPKKGPFTHLSLLLSCFLFCNVSTKLPKGFSKKEQTPPQKKKINECPLKRDHLKRKCHLPTINFRGTGICYFSGGVILRIEFTGR